MPNDPIKKLEWGRIVLSILGAMVIAFVIVSLGVWILLQSPDGAPNAVLEVVCPADLVLELDETSNTEGFGSAIATALATGTVCALRFLTVLWVVYMFLALVIALFLVRRTISQRRRVHLVATGIVLIGVFLLISLLLFP